MKQTSFMLKKLGTENLHKSINVKRKCQKGFPIWRIRKPRCRRMNNENMLKSICPVKNAASHIFFKYSFKLKRQNMH